MYRRAFGPLARKTREWMLRPVRLEMAQEISALRAQHAEEVTSLRAVAGLRKRVHALEAQLKLSQQLLIADPQLPIPSDLQTGPALISVILATYNRAREVVDAIESVRAQTLSRWKLIIVDDGSTDGTESALAAFASDERIRILRQEHCGVCARAIEASPPPKPSS